MKELDKKYVFHIPLCKYVNNDLIPIAIENIIDELIKQLNENGYDSLYMTKVKGYYKSRCFDEILITLFVSTRFLTNHYLPEAIFKKWFKANNNILEQEAYTYECNNKMNIEEI